MILPSGTYFALEAGPFEKLRRLIEEARGIEDVPGRTLKLSRFQASLWSELQDVGVVTAQAAAWQKSVGGLLAGDEVVDRRVPVDAAGQRCGRISRKGSTGSHFCYDHGLGGVLADDMGLGKTVQTLALICHARLERPDAEPFLVVAPTSVVGNWAAECAKFAPGAAGGRDHRNRGPRRYRSADAGPGRRYRRVLVCAVPIGLREIFRACPGPG